MNLKKIVKGIYDSHEPVNGAVDTVKYLSKKYILCAASNGTFEQQKHRLTLAGMIDCFSHLFVFGENRHTKAPTGIF